MNTFSPRASGGGSQLGAIGSLVVNDDLLVELVDLFFFPFDDFGIFTEIINLNSFKKKVLKINLKHFFIIK